MVIYNTDGQKDSSKDKTHHGETQKKEGPIDKTIDVFFEPGIQSKDFSIINDDIFVRNLQEQMQKDYFNLKKKHRDLTQAEIKETRPMLKKY